MYPKPWLQHPALSYSYSLKPVIFKSAGHKIVLDPDWQIRHLKKWRLRDLFIADVMLRAYPWTLLLLRRGEMEDNLNIDIRSRMSALCCLMALASIPLAFLACSWLLVAAFLQRGS